jgi:putative phosphoesterase
MLLGLISDTHGHIRNTLDGLRLLETMGVEQIIHCGDIGSLAIPRLFSPPTHFVFGNVDQDEDDLRSAIHEAGHMCHERFGKLELAGLQIAFLHGDDNRLWGTAVNGGNWDVVCFGHTHRRETRLVGNTLVLNPGAVYRATPHSVATIELPSRKVAFLEFT